jgi:bifunctional non-homologous end joining protein LigD
MIPRTIVQAFLKLSGYDRDKLVPGYQGKFVIQLHSATNLHFDLRLEFPVTSLHDSLGQYEGKRLPGTPEPMEKYPDKPGTVLRSFAVRKHKIPSGTEKLFIVETEDHPLSYFFFSGEITEGYGKGMVDIWDHGTYELLDVEGDRKYTIDFKGNKLKGVFALVKYQQGYLWVKTKNKETL